jgi:DegV family protein with EDD domain
MLRVVTDSAADLTPEESKALGIFIVPLQIQFPEGVLNSEDITRDEFYNRLEAMWPHIPSTSLPSPGMFSDCYRRIAEQDKEIISIHISSGLSNTLESATLGAREVQEANIQIVDSMTLSGGQRFQVLSAAIAARAGKSMTQIVDQLDRIRKSTETVYTLDTMSYLARGGRIGRVQALAGTLLKIKPIIQVDRSDGKYNAIGKERTLARALEAIASHLAKEFGDTRLWVSVMHGQAADYADQLVEALTAKINIAKMETLRISPVLGVHTGPKIVGASVVPIDLMEKLS